MRDREHKLRESGLPEASQPQSPRALAQWSDDPARIADGRPWDVELFPDATVIRIDAHGVAVDSLDVFIDERGVFITSSANDAAPQAPGALRIVIPLPGADCAAHPHAELASDILTITLPRGSQGQQQRIPINAQRRRPCVTDDSPKEPPAHA